MRMSELWYERKAIQDANGYQMPAVLSEATTLRDQFAMAALPALIADPDSVAYPIGHAKQAYRYADAMLKAREMELE